MIPVTTRTKTDNPKIVFAGVDAGAKILVELTGEPAGSAAAATMYQKKSATAWNTQRVTRICPYRIALIPFICYSAEPHLT